MTTPTVAVKPKIKHVLINRRQLCFTQLDLDHLIEEQHAARVIWEMVQRVDVSRFEEQ